MLATRLHAAQSNHSNSFTTVHKTYLVAISHVLNFHRQLGKTLQLARHPHLPLRTLRYSVHVAMNEQVPRVQAQSCRICCPSIHQRLSRLCSATASCVLSTLPEML